MAEHPANNTVYLPWGWTITPEDPNVHQCPPVSSLLGTFAAVNGVVSVLAVIFGHRLVVEKLTCGACGKKGSKAWKYMWILPVGLQLAANAFIAAIIKRTAGYDANYKIWELMFFLVARPRLSWIVLGAFAFRERQPSKIKPSPSKYALIDNYDGSGHKQEDEYLGDGDFPWWSAFMSQFIGEFLLQIISLYIMGRTAHFAATHGYYKVYETKMYHSLPHGAHMMYAGALYYLVAGSIFLLAASTFILAIYTEHTFVSSTRQVRKHKSRITTTLFILLISTWMGSWIFWAGFVKLAGNLYCPPALISQGVIWTIFSLIGIITSAGT